MVKRAGPEWVGVGEWEWEWEVEARGGVGGGGWIRVRREWVSQGGLGEGRIVGRDGGG